MRSVRIGCFAGSAILLLLLLSALVAGQCGDGGSGAEACGHFARTTLLIIGGGALLLGLVGVRLVGWEERHPPDEEQARKPHA
jgi:hypothetical protein